MALTEVGCNLSTQTINIIVTAKRRRWNNVKIPKKKRCSIETEVVFLNTSRVLLFYSLINDLELRY